MRIYLGFLAVFCCIVCSSKTFADGDPDNSWTVPKEAHVAETPNRASDASFDKRLPPVLPGEVVNDSGRKMKVWSTAGPVPVASAPEPWKSNEELKHISPGGVGVIVDQRKDAPVPQNTGTVNSGASKTGNSH